MSCPRTRHVWCGKANMNNLVESIVMNWMRAWWFLTRRAGGGGDPIDTHTHTGQLSQQQHPNTQTRTQTHTQLFLSLLPWQRGAEAQLPRFSGWFGWSLTKAVPTNLRWHLGGTKEKRWACVCMWESGWCVVCQWWVVVVVETMIVVVVISLTIKLLLILFLICVVVDLCWRPFLHFLRVFDSPTDHYDSTVGEIGENVDTKSTNVDCTTCLLYPNSRA